MCATGRDSQILKWSVSRLWGECDRRDMLCCLSPPHRPPHLEDSFPGSCMCQVACFFMFQGHLIPGSPCTGHCHVLGFLSTRWESKSSTQTNCLSNGLRKFMFLLDRNLLRKPGWKITAPKSSVSENWGRRKPRVNKHSLKR